jgi:hypothetical protein
MIHGEFRGIRYPGDDGSEPEHIRDAKAEEYAKEVTTRAMEHAASAVQPGARVMDFFFSKSLSVFDAMIYVTIGQAIWSLL